MGITALLKELTPEQRIVLFDKLNYKRSETEADKHGDALDFPQIESVPQRKSGPFALTDIQQAYWVGRQEGFELGNIAAHGYLEVDSNAISTDRLIHAFNLLIKRHDMLRAIISKDGTQTIMPEVPYYEFVRYDLTSVSETERKQSLENVRDEMSHQILDSTKWPLFDLRLSILPEQHIRLHISVDILILDAMSFDIISEEWRLLYENPELTLKEIDFSYADYVAGLEQLKAHPLYQESQNYWRNKIKELAPAPEFPLAKSLESIKSPKFVRRSARLNKEQWGKIRQTSQNLGITPSVALLTVYSYVMSRWSTRKRFTLNLTLFNRLPFHPSVNDLVGDFTSVVLLDIDMSNDISFSDRARQLQEQLWHDMDHRFVSGVWVARELTEFKRDSKASQMPIVFTSALRSKSSGEEKSAMRWLGEINYTITQTPQVWLDHQVMEDDGELVYDWDAVEELFPTGLLDDMFESYNNLLNVLSSNPSLWEFSGFDILPPEQKQLFQSVNNTTVAVPKGLLHHPFLNAVIKYPNNIAVIDSDVHLSYSQLYSKSNSLAQVLWNSGSVGGELVGVLLKKSHQQLVAVLGILEAGCAYVPIEANLSEHRVAELIKLSDISKLITTSKIVNQLSLPKNVNTILIDQIDLKLPLLKLPELQNPDELAYVIYTSGSTGVPKGVMIDHRGALNTIVDINSRFNVDSTDSVLALSALNFDLSVWDIFGVLGAGGTVVLPSHERAREPSHWNELVEKHKVTIWNTVPALMDIYIAYLRDISGASNNTLKTVMMSGDWIPLSLPEQIRKHCSNASPISLGGATEASIWSIAYPIQEIKSDWRSVPYGMPMNNQTIYVYDQHLLPCPVWVPGELYIGGVGVAKGYRNDEKRTAASFIVHPKTGEKLYRTGDLGRYLPDGNIEFLGRVDFQVKVNGYRVELGEIEANMIAFKGVQSAVVALNGAAGESKQLVGYYVRQINGDSKASEKLKFRLSQLGIRNFGSTANRIQLPENTRLNDLVFQARYSQRSFSHKKIPLDKISTLLSNLSQRNISGAVKYRYASGGSLYPVQTYLFVKENRVESMSPGLYYYHPKDTNLVEIRQGPVFNEDYFPGANRHVANDAAFYIFLIANLDAIEPIYGSSSETLCFLEAGLMSHLLELEAVNIGLGMCQLGGFNFDMASDDFELPSKSKYLHCLVGGLASKPEEKENLMKNNDNDTAGESDEKFEHQMKLYLNSRLPEYMVPKQFIKLEQMPLSANGKVDRKELPKPQARTLSEKKMYKKPDNELAVLICDTWKEVLKIEQVGIVDNFFDLGGTSVDMIKIHTKLQPRLPKEISLIDMFFTYANIDALVAHLQQDDAVKNKLSINNQDKVKQNLRRLKEKRTSQRDDQNT